MFILYVWYMISLSPSYCDYEYWPFIILLNVYQIVQYFSLVHYIRCAKSLTPFLLLVLVNTFALTNNLYWVNNVMNFAWTYILMQDFLKPGTQIMWYRAIRTSVLPFIWSVYIRIYVPTKLLSHGKWPS